MVITPFFYILDELFYSNYKNVAIKNPVFIVSNPRNGTTHLHKLLSLDKQFNSLLLYQTILPSVSFIRFITFLNTVDYTLGSPFTKLFSGTSNLFFKAWDKIHKIDFSKEEEDEVES